MVCKNCRWVISPQCSKPIFEIWIGNCSFEIFSVDRPFAARPSHNVHGNIPFTKS